MVKCGVKTFLFLCTTIVSLAQEAERNPDYFGVKKHYGFIIPHSEAITSSGSSKPSGVEFTWGRVLLRREDYQRTNNFAKAGLSFNWYNFGNPEVLGSSFNLTGFGEPVFRFRKRLYAGAKCGIGFSYLTRTYHEHLNPENKHFASPISFLLYVSPNLNYKLSNQLHLKLTGSYNHISNGGVKQPNYGMNFPTMAVGAEYSLTNYILPVNIEAPKPEFNRRINFQAEMFATAKNIDKGNNFEEAGLVEGEEFDAMLLWLYGMQVRAEKVVGRMSALSLAAEWVADNYGEEYLRRAGIETRHHLFALMAGHELLFGQFGLRLQLAFYVYAPYERDFMYERYTLSYRLSDMLTIGASIKAHLNIADSFDARLAINLSRLTGN